MGRPRLLTELLQGLKTWLDRAKGTWAEELQHVLWVYWTTQRVSTGKTPFNHVFGIQVIIPLEVGLPSPWIENFDENNNSEWLRVNLDLLEVVYERVAVRMVTY